jgi:hypothetical protein
MFKVGVVNGLLLGPQFLLKLVDGVVARLLRGVLRYASFSDC